MSVVPVAPGAYALLLRIASNTCLRIGSLGTVDFLAGDYLYLGSALGPGGLRARLHHHLSSTAKLRWHLDYLRGIARPTGFWWKVVDEKPAAGQPRLECLWAQALTSLPGAGIPLRGFGSSDCRSGCGAHLLFFGKMGVLSDWRNIVEETLEGLSGPVCYGDYRHPAGPVHEATRA